MSQKIIKRCAAFLLGLLVAGTTFHMTGEQSWAAAVTSQTEDTEKPAIHVDTIKIDKTEARSGDVVTVSVKVTDNAGIARVYFDMKGRNVNNSTFNNIYMRYNQETGLYEGSFIVDDTMPQDHWYIDCVGARDINGNFAHVFASYNKPLGEVNIINPGVDSENPVIHGDTLTIDKKELALGETVTISVKISDNTKVQCASISMKNIDSDKRIYYKDMTYNSKTDRFEYCMTANDKEDVGHWEIYSMLAYDVIDNADVCSFESWFIVSPDKNGWDYSCEVQEETLYSGNEEMFTCSAPQGERVAVRILDPEVVRVQRVGSQNSTENGVNITTRKYQFQPYRSGKTLVEVYNSDTNEIYKVYKVQVFPRTYSACAGQRMKLKIVSKIHQEYIATDENNEPIEMSLTGVTIIMSDSGRQMEYAYELVFKDTGKKKIYITGSSDKKTAEYAVNVGEHEWDTGSITTQPECLKTGVKTYTCLNCKEQRREAVPALGHQFSSQWTVDKEATCSEKGQKSRHCIRCEAVTDQMEIPATQAHVYTKPEFHWSDDYTNCGVTVKCQNCGNTVNHQASIKKQIEEPTCTKPGKEIYAVSGSIAGTTFNDRREVVLPAKGHSFKEGKCTVCGLVTALPTAPKLKSAANTKDGVTLTWEKVENATSYRIYRKVKGASSWGTKYAEVTGTSFTDKKVKNQSAYTYTVRAFYGSSIKSPYNNRGIQITHLTTPQVSAPVNTTEGIKVSWKGVSGATSYRIYRKEAGAKSWGTKYAEVKGTSFVDKKVKADTKYTYTVKAFKGSIYSGYDTVGKSVQRLQTPSISSVENVQTGMKVSWKSVKGAASYRIYRKAKGEASWKPLTVVTATSYIDTSAKSNTVYTYTVRAFDKTGSKSDYSRSGKTQTCISTPQISAPVNAMEGIKVSWKGVSGATSYRIYRKEAGAKSWGTKYAEVKGTSFVDKKVKEDTKYTYTVKAFKGSVYSGYDTVGQSVMR